MLTGTSPIALNKRVTCFTSDFSMLSVYPINAHIVLLANKKLLHSNSVIYFFIVFYFCSSVCSLLSILITIYLSDGEFLFIYFSFILFNHLFYRFEHTKVSAFRKQLSTILRLVCFFRLNFVVNMIHLVLLNTLVFMRFHSHDPTSDD